MISDQKVIGVDVGGTKIAAGLVSAEGKIVSAVRRLTDVSSPEATLDSISRSIFSLTEKLKLDIHELGPIGFGIPGLVDRNSGIGIASVNLGWKNVKVRSGLESRLGVRCVIENDVRAGALGELRFGTAKGYKNFVYLNIGTGISAVVILDGAFYSGVNGIAGEIGHAVIDPGGPLCKCGGQGCFEAIASGPAIAQRAIKKIRNGKSSMLSLDGQGPLNTITPEEIFIAAEQKDGLALEVINEVGGFIAHALEYLVLAYDPQIIVIGGSICLKSKILNRIISQKLQELSDQSWVFAKAYRKGLIRLSTLGNNAGVFGAAALVS
jgi:glucokinase